MNTMELIQQRLQDLEPESIEIQDDSAQHRGHAGAAAGGGHYHLFIQAASLNALGRVAAHRAIYQRVQDLIPLPIHALQITLLI